MKRLLLAFAIVLLLAGLAFAGDLGAVSATWTRATDTDFQAAAGTNWSIGGVPCAAGDYPGNGSTIDSTTSTVPATNRPVAGTFHFNITNAVNPTISNFLNGAAIGNVTINNASINLVCFNNITGTVTVLAGILQLDTVTVTGLLSVSAGATLKFFDSRTVTANGGVQLAGTLDCTAQCILDSASPVLITGSAAIIDLGNSSTFLGGLNAAGYTVTYENTGATSPGPLNATITCDQAGTLDLGTTTANYLAVTTTAAVTIGNSFACGSFSPGADVTGASKTITVSQAGGFVPTAGTLTGTLTVNLSGGAGVYTQTGLTIAADAILNVTTGTGAITYTALTKTGTGAINVTMAENANIGWNSALAGRITLLTINTGKTGTQTAGVVFRSLVGPGTLAGSTFATTWRPAANGDVCDAPMTGTGNFNIAQSITPLTIATSPNVGTRTVQYSTVTTAVALTLSGLTCGPLIVTSGGAATSTLTVNGNTSGSTITFGTAATADRIGSLTLGAGYIHKRTDAILVAGTGITHALNLQGRGIFTGTFTGTGITVTPTSEGQIDCGGVGRVTAVTSTGQRLVVRRAVDASGNPVRSWNGDGCTNVMFKGRKVIGEPGVN